MNTPVIGGFPRNGDVQEVEGGDIAPLSEALILTSQMRDKIEKIAGELGRLKLSDFFNGLQDVSFDSEEYNDEQMKEFMIRWLSIIERSQDFLWDDYTEQRIMDRFHDIIANISKSPEVRKYATNPVIWSMILGLSKNRRDRWDDKNTGIPKKE